MPASWWKRIAGAYSPRRHHWAELGDHGAVRAHRARVAGEDLVRQRRVRLEEVAADSRLLVGDDQRGVLRAPPARASKSIAGLERRAGDRAGRAASGSCPGRQSRTSSSRAVLGVDSPGGLGASFRHHPDRPQRAVARPADQAAVGEGVRDVGDRRAGQPLAGEDVGDARRIGGQRFGGDPALGLRRTGPPPAVRGRRRAARARAGPREEARRRRRRSSTSAGPICSTACRRPSTSRSAEAVGVSAMPKTATITFSEKSSRMMSSLLAHQLRDAVAGRAGAPDVDREPQRVPGGDAGSAGEALVEHVEAGDLPDSLASPGRASRASRRAARAPR